MDILESKTVNTFRKSAVTIGTLFLTALILNKIASGILNPVLTISDFLLLVYPNRIKVIFGNLLNIICAISMISIPIILFPVVGGKHKYLALGYIVFRALEGILFIYLAIKTLLLISLSNEYINAEPEILPDLQTLGNSIHAEKHWATIIYILIFTLGGATFYYLLYKSKIVPRFLSIWGFSAIVLMFAGVSLAIFDLGIFDHMPMMKGMAYFAPPIALNELVLGIWLIAKGFNSSTTDLDGRFKRTTLTAGEGK